MSRETLSPGQAQSIVVNVNSIVMKCKNKIEQKYTDFVEAVSKIWEDENAVECFKNHKQIMEEIIKKLNEYNHDFENKVESIANRYAHVGNMKQISVERINLTPIINVDKIKNHFVDGENGDDFGFINPEHGAEQVMDAYHELEVQLKIIAQEANASISKTSAFGNIEVKLALVRAASQIISAMNEALDRAKKVVKDFIQSTAEAYEQAGKTATETTSENKHEKPDFLIPDLPGPYPYGPPLEGLPFPGSNSDSGSGIGPDGHE